MKENLLLLKRTLKKKNLQIHDFNIKKYLYLDDIGNKFNNTYNGTIKMQPVDVKSSTYIDFDKNNSIKIG